jgi:hypothetical protein
MVKILLISLTLLIVLTTDLKGQEIDWDKYEVGLDLLWIIKRNNIPPSFFIKKLELKQKKNDLGFTRRGYRFRVGANYDQPNEKTQTPGYTSLRQSYYSIVFRPGYEWHKRIKSFDIYYGFDVNTYLSGSKTENSIVYINSDTGGFYYLLYTQKNRFARIGVSPVIGTTIKIYKNISLTLESTIDFYYSNQKNTYSNNPNYENLQVSGNGFGITTYPLYTLNVSFSF